MKHDRESTSSIIERCKALGYDPMWIVGFVDSDGNFNISKSRDIKRSNGWNVHCQFKVTQHIRSLQVLEDLKIIFGCGTICRDNRRDECKKFTVKSTKDLHNIIIPFFKEYKLVTSKALDFEAMSLAINNMYSRAYLLDNLEYINNLSLNMNKTRSLFERWNYTIALISTLKLDPNWVSGITDGDGTFGFYRTKSNSIIINYGVSARTTELGVLVLLANYFNGSTIPKLEECKNPSNIKFKCAKFYIPITSITKVIEHFTKYPLHTTKRKDFEDRVKLINIKTQNLHKTEAGLIEMEALISRMNSTRPYTKFDGTIGYGKKI